MRQEGQGVLPSGICSGRGQWQRTKRMATEEEDEEGELLYW